MNWLGQLRLRTDHAIKLLADLTGDRARPAGANPAHVDQLFALAEIDVGNSDPAQLEQTPWPAPGCVQD